MKTFLAVMGSIFLLILALLICVIIWDKIKRAWDRTGRARRSLERSNKELEAKIEALKERNKFLDQENTLLKGLRALCECGDEQINPNQAERPTEA